MTLPTALAAPVEEGMMFALAPRPPRQSLEDGPSTLERRGQCELKSEYNCLRLLGGRRSMDSGH